MLVGKLLCPGLVPFQGDILKGVVHFGKLRGLDSLFVHGWVNTLGQHLFRLFTPFSGVFERHGRVLAKAEEFFFLLEAVGHPPQLAAGGGYEKKQPSAVKILFGLAGVLDSFDVGIGERHGYSLVLTG